MTACVRRRNCRRACVCVLVLFWLGLLADVANAQGLVNDPETRIRSSGSIASLQSVYGQSRRWLSAYKQNPRSACSKSGASLCAGAEQQQERQALMLATSPWSFDARDGNFTGGRLLIGPVKEQGDCGTCVSFAVLAAVQTSYAAATQRSLDPSATLSEADFFFCKGVSSGLIRTCGSGMSMREGVTTWLNIHKARQLPVLESCLPYTPNTPSCSAYKCRTSVPDLQMGSFLATPLSSTWEMQRHIRQHGSIVCRINLYSDLKPFFVGKPMGVYPGPGPNATLVEGHAVQVVGYDNDGQFWVIKNSWGPNWGDKGFFRISYESPSVCDPSETYGFIYTPDLPPPLPRQRLAATADKEGCFVYTSVTGDYPELVATVFGVPVEKLLLDNTAVLPDPSTIPAGTKLTLCGLPGDLLTASTSAGAVSPVTLGQMQGLLALAQSLDPTGELAWNSSAEAATGAYCRWPGVTCLDGKLVALLDIKNKGLAGQLPPASVLQQLPALTSIVLTNNKIGGTLPADWSVLRNMQVVSLGNNRLKGTLPDDWANMRALGWLYLQDNGLQGSLPPVYSRLLRLREISLGNNSMTAATLPVSWASLTNLRLIYLYQNSFTGAVLPPEWSGMHSLAEVNVGSAGLVGPLPESWSKLTKLNTFRAFSNSLNGTLPTSWTRLSQLSRVMLNDNKLTGPLNPAWANITSLTDLQLNNNLLEGSLPDGWGTSLTKLKLLYVGANNLQGTLPEAWRNLTSIVDLRLHDNNFSGTVPKVWGPAWSNITRVTLYSNSKLEGCLPKEWKGRVNEPGSFLTQADLTVNTNIPPAPGAYCT